VLRASITHSTDTSNRVAICRFRYPPGPL
jgi:hypothetical protein